MESSTAIVIATVVFFVVLVAAGLSGCSTWHGAPAYTEQSLYIALHKEGAL